MNTHALSIEMLDKQPFSVNDAIRHVVEHHGIRLEEYIVLDHAGLEAKMPHRETALCLDFGFIPCGEDVDHYHAFGVRYISEDCFEMTGHFPDNKRLPGHWAIEEMCLTSALISDSIASERKSDRKYLPVITEIHRASFFRPILPGNVLVTRSRYIPEGISTKDATATDKRRPIFEIQAYVNGIPCAKAIIGAVLVPTRG